MLDNKFNYLIVVLFSITYLLNAQIKDVKENKNLNQIVECDIGSFYHTGMKVFTSPFSYDKNDWIITGSVISATAIAFAIDNKERTFWKMNQSKTLDNVSSVGHFYGGIQNAAILGALFYIGGIVSDEPIIRKTGRNLGEALFYAGITTLSLKTIFGRSRPFTNEGPYHFKFFQTDFAHTSFPSGDITVAFTVSSVLARTIDNTYATVILYSVAGTTFIQRMYADDHWLSDSILAAAIGYFIGNAVVDLEKSDTKSNMKNRISFFPKISNNGLGVTLSYSF